MCNNQRNHCPLSVFILVICFALFLCIPQPTAAQDDLKPEDVFKMSLQELSNLEVVTAAKHLEKIRDIPASVVVITREEIETSGCKTLEEILQNIPGFYMIDDYNWLSTINFGVRGFFSTGTFNDVIILVNGVNQLGDSWGYYPDSKINVPVEAIDRIEVIRGPMSVIYGSGAFMGAINIITNKIPPGGPFTIVSASAGSDETYKLFTRLSGKIGEARYVFNGSIFDTGGLDEPFSKMVSNPSYLEAVGLTQDATTGGKMEENRKHFNLSATFKNLTFNLSHIETKKEVFDGLPSVGEGTLISTDATNVSLLYEKEFSEHFSIKGQLNYFYHHYMLNYEVLFENSFALNQVTTNAYEVALDAFIKPLPKLEITGGIYHRAVTYFYKFYDYPIYGDPYSNTEIYIPHGDDVGTYALYVQAKIALAKRLTLIGGIRFEKLNRYGMVYALGMETPSERLIEGAYTNDDIKVIPRLALIYSLNERNVIKLLYGEAIKQPSIEQNSGMLKFDLPSLEPARIKTFELNYIYSPSEKFAANISIFRNELDNLISRKNEYDIEKGEWITYSANAGRMSTNGLEVGLIFEPVANLRFNLSGIFQDSKNEEAGYEDIGLGYSPGFLGYLKLSYRISKNVVLAFTGRYIGDMDTEWNNEPRDPDANDWSPKGRLGKSIDAYAVLNANVRVEDLFIKGLFINLNISNLLDEEVRFPATRSNAWADRGTLGFGRTLLLSLGYKF